MERHALAHRLMRLATQLREDGLAAAADGVQQSAFDVSRVNNVVALLKFLKSGGAKDVTISDPLGRGAPKTFPLDQALAMTDSTDAAAAVTPQGSGWSATIDGASMNISSDLPKEPAPSDEPKEDEKEQEKEEEPKASAPPPAPAPAESPAPAPPAEEGKTAQASLFIQLAARLADKRDEKKRKDEQRPNNCVSYPSANYPGPDGDGVGSVEINMPEGYEARRGVLDGRA